MADTPDYCVYSKWRTKFGFGFCASFSLHVPHHAHIVFKVLEPRRGKSDQFSRYPERLLSFSLTAENGTVCHGDGSANCSTSQVRNYTILWQRQALCFRAHSGQALAVKHSCWHNLKSQPRAGKERHLWGGGSHMFPPFFSPSFPSFPPSLLLPSFPLFFLPPSLSSFPQLGDSEKPLKWYIPIYSFSPLKNVYSFQKILSELPASD